MSCEKGKPHERPVHLNLRQYGGPKHLRGSQGHVWLCLSCDRQLSGPKLPDEERIALVEYSKHLTELIKASSKEMLPAHNTLTGKDKDMQLTVTLTGANLEEVRKQAMQFVNAAAQATATTEAVATTAKKKAAPVVADDEDFDAPPTKKKAAPAVADDEDFDAPTAQASEDEEDFDAPPKKTGKAKPAKVDKKDLNDAAKAYAREHGREGVLEILEKKFKVSTLSELTADQYAQALKYLKV